MGGEMFSVLVVDLQADATDFWLTMLAASIPAAAAIIVVIFGNGYSRKVAREQSAESRALFVEQFERQQQLDHEKWLRDQRLELITEALNLYNRVALDLAPLRSALFEDHPDEAQETTAQIGDAEMGLTLLWGRSSLLFDPPVSDILAEMVDSVGRAADVSCAEDLDGFLDEGQACWANLVREGRLLLGTDGFTPPHGAPASPPGES